MMTTKQPHNDLQRLPRENANGVWPQLRLDDPAYMRHAAATPQQIALNLKRNLRANWRAALRADLVSALVKGLIVGLLAFGVWYGAIPAVREWWIGTGIVIPTHPDVAAWRALAGGLTPVPADWARAAPWLIPLVGAVALTALFGADAGLLLLGLGCVVLGAPALLTHPLMFLAFLGGGALLRCLYEVLPQAPQQAVNLSSRGS